MMVQDVLPEEHVLTAAASWSVPRTAAACLVANSDQQTGRWRLERGGVQINRRR